MGAFAGLPYSSPRFIRSVQALRNGAWQGHIGGKPNGTQTPADQGAILPALWRLDLAGRLDATLARTNGVDRRIEQSIQLPGSSWADRHDLRLG